VKIARFYTGGLPRYGILDEEMVRQLAGNPFGKLKIAGIQFAADEIKLLAPCRPSKIVAIGLNYHSHAAELGYDLPRTPLIFLKPPSAVIGPVDCIVYPPLSAQVDFEGELGVVIGKKVRCIAPKDAAGCILGYTCFNDVTARDLQKEDGQWARAKGFDTFAAVGPIIETELDAGALKIETRLNGVVRQSGNTADLIFKVPELVSAVSQVMTLFPGDIIATGTPGGIGAMQPGDVVQVTIEGIGTLENTVRLAD